MIGRTDKGGLSNKLCVMKTDTRSMYSLISGNRTTTAAITVFAPVLLKYTIPFNVSFPSLPLSVHSLFLILCLLYFLSYLSYVYKPHVFGMPTSVFS